MNECSRITRHTDKSHRLLPKKKLTKLELVM
jgi:hypothetical protein